MKISIFWIGLGLAGASCFTRLARADFRSEIRRPLAGYKVEKHKLNVLDEYSDNGSSLDIYRRGWKGEATERVMDLEIGKSNMWEIWRFFYSEGRLKRFYRLEYPYHFEPKKAEFDAGRPWLRVAEYIDFSTVASRKRKVVLQVEGGKSRWSKQSVSAQEIATIQAKFRSMQAKFGSSKPPTPR